MTKQEVVKAWDEKAKMLEIDCKAKARSNLLKVTIDFTEAMDKNKEIARALIEIVDYDIDEEKFIECFKSIERENYGMYYSEKNEKTYIIEKVGLLNEEIEGKTKNVIVYTITAFR